MQQSKVVQFLKTLTSSEWSRFEKYILAPHLGLNASTIRLFAHLQPHYPTFDCDQLNKETVFEHVFPDQSYSANKLYTTNKYLLKAVMDFLVDQEMKRDPFVYQSHLLQTLRNRGLDHFMLGNIKDTQQLFDKQGVRDSQFYYNQFRFHEFVFDWTLENQNRIVDAGIEVAIDSLEHFYMIEKLRFACAILNRQMILADTTEIRFMREILHYCETENLDEIPILQIYYLIYQMLVLPAEDGEEYFGRLRKLIPSLQDKISSEELYNAYSFCLNFCIKRYKAGKPGFLREMQTLYQDMMDMDLLFQSGESANLVMKNLVTLGIKLKEYSWTEKIIKQNQHKLPGKFKESTTSFNLANLYFAKGEYEKSLQFLQEVSFIDPFYRIIYDVLLMKNFYECGEYDPLLARCHSFYTYLKRDKTLSEQNLAAYINAAKFMRKIARAKFGTKKVSPKLTEELKGYALMVDREWFERKVHELLA